MIRHIIYAAIGTLLLTATMIAVYNGGLRQQGLKPVTITIGR